MKKQLISALAILIVLSGCGEGNNAKGTNTGPQTVANISDQNWKNGVWIQKDGRNGLVIEAAPENAGIAVSAKLKFAKTGERTVKEVVVSPPFINIFVDGALDPSGDGYPNKVSLIK